MPQPVALFLPPGEICRLVQDLDNLTDDEKTNLSRSVDDLVRQTAQTQVAAGRFKRYMAKAGPAASDAMEKTLGLFRVLSGRRSQIEFPTVEVDGVDEVLLIAETARRGLDPLNP